MARLYAFTVVWGLLFAVSCTPKSKLITSFGGSTMGTTYSVKIADPVEDKDLIQKEVEEVLLEVNRQMSTYQKDSEISKLNQASKNQILKISPWFYQVLDFSLDLAQKTEGAYDPTIGPLVNLWGFGPTSKKKIPSEEEIQKAKKVVGFDKLTLYPKETSVTKALDGVYVDLSSSAKGFGVDQVSEKLLEKGHSNHLVEIGGELRARGSKKGKPWRVAIEKPNEEGRSVQEVVELKNLSVATSGNYRNFFKKEGQSYSHTLDQKTGRPVQTKVLSATVFAPNCMEADAWATALMALGVSKAQEKSQQHDLSVLLIYEEDGKVKIFRK